MNKCSHDWKAISKHSEFGTVYQDECCNCGCIGVLANEPDANGFYAIVAQPMAQVIDLNEFRKRKELESGKLNTFGDTGF